MSGASDIGVYMSLTGLCFCLNQAEQNEGFATEKALKHANLPFQQTPTDNFINH